MRNITLAAIALASSALPAQIVLTPVADGATGGSVGLDNQSHHQQAVDAAGNIWMSFSKSGLSLYVSADDGLTWTLGGKAASSKVSFRNCIAVDPDCRHLHVAWDATNGNPESSIYYQVFDTVTRTFIGTEELLLQGTSAAEGWRFQDIAVTPKGTVVVFANSLGTVSGSVTKTWSSSMLVKPAGQATFNPRLVVNEGSSGLRLNTAVIGEVVHTCYRDSSGGHNVDYRAFNTETMTFVASEISVGGQKAGDVYSIGNGLSIAKDDNNNLYVAYSIGDVSPTQDGSIRVAFARPPYTTWTQQEVAADPPITERNTAFHYSLSPTTDGQVYVVYTKISDSHTTIYTREMNDGAFVGTEQTVYTSTTGQEFYRVTGHRSHGARIGLNAMVIDDSVPGRAIYLLDGTADPIWGRSGQLRYVGNSCQGALAQAPRIGVSIPPTAGRALDLTIKDATPSSAAFLSVGLQCYANPIELSFLGAPGCGLFADNLIVVGIGTNASGEFSANFVMPAAAVPILVQGAVVSPSANAAGLVTTRLASFHL